MKVLGAFALTQRVKKQISTECVRETRAEIISLGGAIVLLICILLTIAALMAAQFSEITNIQRIILVILTIVSWFYFFDSLSERLQIIDRSIEYSALFGRRKIIHLDELEAMFLVYQGFNLEKGIESIEFRCVGKEPERISLGPCWQRNKLERFLKSVEFAMNDPHLFENIR